MTIFFLVLYLYHIQLVSTQFPWHSMVMRFMYHHRTLALACPLWER